MRNVAHIPVLCALLGVAGCGDSPSINSSIAAAVDTKSSGQTVAQKLKAREQQKRQKQREAEAEVEQTREQEISAATNLPQEMPKDLKSACQEVVDAYDDFMKRGADDDVLSWWDGRRKKLGLVRQKCNATPGLKVAACKAHALRQPLHSLDGIERVEAAGKLLIECDEKFGEVAARPRHRDQTPG